jgi:unsaturated chondroitin disaccharide hydrolase
MMLKIKLLPIIGMLLFGLSVSAQNFKPNDKLLKTIHTNFSTATAQYKLMMKSLEDDRFPKTFDVKNGKLVTSDSGWWCSGFYPGTLLEIYAQRREPHVKPFSERTV